jgi:hypothetical protein
MGGEKATSLSGIALDYPVGKAGLRVSPGYSTGSVIVNAPRMSPAE